MARVILIEDDALVRTLLMRRMLAAGWSVTALRDGRELEKVVAEERPDLLVVDLGLPYVDGFALVEGLRAQGVRTPVLVISAYELPHLHEAARNSGADDVLQKPFDQEELIERMGRLLAA
jgi:DNA-binding response OmpR family regulator